MATPKARLFQIYPFGKGLNFLTESVITPPSGEAVPGSTSYFKPNYAVTFRCTLTLPDGSQVVSDMFQRKKDAEHDASQRALDQMRVSLAPTSDVLTMDEKWENLRRRFLETFSDKNVLSYSPLREHFKIAVKRKGPRYGQVPIAAIAALDAKINTLLKVIDRKSETDPVYAVALLCKAASTCSSVKLDIDNLCLSRVEPFKPEVEQELLLGKQTESKEHPKSNGKQTESTHANGKFMEIMEHPKLNGKPMESMNCPKSNGKQTERMECPESNAEQMVTDGLCFLAVCIPSSSATAVVSSRVGAQQDEYYLDVLAQKIGVEDGSRLVMSRPIGRTHPAMRLYWGAPKHLPPVEDLQSDFVVLSGSTEVLEKNSTIQREWKTEKNMRASFLMGYPVYGDVLLAAVGGDWRSEIPYAMDITLSTYYRLFLGRFPLGNYKLSRGAVLASNLPLLFSSRLQWRGMSPRGLMIEFCQQHRLREPVFALSFPGSETPNGTEVEGKIPELAEIDETRSTKIEDVETAFSKNDDDGNAAAVHGGPFMCTLRIEFQKGSVTEFESAGPNRNRHDAIQNCALKALHKFRPWFGNCLRGLCYPVIPDKINNVSGNALSVGHNDVIVAGTVCSWEPSGQDIDEVDSAVDSSQVDQIPPAGGMVTIRYIIVWLREEEGRHSSVLLEKKEEFSFELGIGAVIGELDAIVAEMPVGQTACFYTPPPPAILLLAAADGLTDIDELTSPVAGKLKYTVQLLKFVEPPEERMEAALFKPSLSKQRLVCALSIIQKLGAKSLIDLGCGSGSLLDNLLEEPTGLVELTGVDISPKSLVRAAKVLSTKLMEDQPGKQTLESIKLYEGSIADFSSDMQGIDVAVCIEVVEHMDPGPLSMFGSTVLGKLQPRVLIVSTPNFEYNPILQGLEWDPHSNSLRRLGASTDICLLESTRVESNSGSMEKRIRLSDVKDGAVHANSKGRVAQQVVKFRNEDHRFEWTRAEFRHWAMTMATDYQYDVTFDGVGGSGEDEGPGYASQIAIFTRRMASPMQTKWNDEVQGNENDENGECSPHQIVWQWKSVQQPNIS